MYDHLKPIIDLTLGVILLVLLSPLMLLLTVTLVFLHRESPFFLHQRPGKNGKLFWMIKFRTMEDCHNASGALMTDNKRVTTFGKILRRTSMDELPQLINVVKGDMSLVGPRPLLVEYLPLYTLNQNRRHEVRPGMTGLAQVSGRNTITWQQKFYYDIWYVDHISFMLDVMILITTIVKVINREGIDCEDFD